MRIAYVNADRGIPVFGDKGASVHVAEMMRAFGGIGCDVRLIATKLGDGERSDLAGRVELVQGPLRSASESGVRANKERRYLETGDAVEQRLCTLYREWPFDLIYERYSLWSAAGVRAGSRLGVPAILEVNAPLVAEQAEHRELALTDEAEAIEAEVFGGADAIAAVSSAVAKYTIARGASAGRVKVLTNAVDTGRFHPDVEAADTGLPGDAFVIGFTGSLKRWHGVDVLLDAFREVHATIREARLLLVGDGPERRWIDGYLTGAGLGQVALCTGWVDHRQLPGLLAAMSVATAPYPPSDDFYFSPLKLFEYLAVGLPVVASRIGQVAETIEHGASGLLVAPGDSRALARALMCVHAEPWLKARLARSAAAEGARHSWTGNAEAIVELARRIRRAA